MNAIKHESIRPDRDDVIGEVVFSQHWKRLMSEPYEFADDDEPEPQLRRIIHRRPTQVDATVAATIIQWLGTNVGGALLYEGRKVREQVDSGRMKAACFVAVWALDNRHRRWVDHGVTLLQGLLVQPDVPRDWAGTPINYPRLLLTHVEVAEAIMAWLGETAGWSWLETVEAEIALRRDAERHYRQQATRQAS